MKKVRSLISIILASAVLLTACGKSQPEEMQVSESATPQSQQQTSYTIWLAPYLPEAMLDEISLPSKVIEVNDKTEADLLVDVSADHPVSQWIYVLVAPSQRLRMRSAWTAYRHFGKAQRRRIFRLKNSLWMAAPRQSLKNCGQRGDKYR